MSKIRLIDGLSEHIISNDGYIVSEGTLNPKHLILDFLALLEPCDEIQEILYNPMVRDEMEICFDLWEAIEQIEVGEYFFCSHPGDGACIGWFHNSMFD